MHASKVGPDTKPYYEYICVSETDLAYCRQQINWFNTCVKNDKSLKTQPDKHFKNNFSFWKFNFCLQEFSESRNFEIRYHAITFSGPLG